MVRMHFVRDFIEIKLTGNSDSNICGFRLNLGANVNETLAGHCRFQCRAGVG
jgi:hypothetical protein